ncbi:MAG: tetratricopeptide repeat protein [Candidatus Binatia bacterium]
MPRPSTRITRKNIRQPDQFLILTGQVLEFIEKHKTLCLLSLAGILLLGLAAAGWSVYRARQDQLAMADFNKALALFRSGKFREALSGFENAHAYHSSALSGYALLYQANSQLELKETENAVKTLERLVAQERKPTLLRQLALLNLGHAQESRSHWKEAAQSYGEAEKIDGPYKEAAILNKARCATEAKDYAQALESYRSYLKTYPNSSRSAEVSLRVQKLEAK